MRRVWVLWNIAIWVCPTITSDACLVCTRRLVWTRIATRCLRKTITYMRWRMICAVRICSRGGGRLIARRSVLRIRHGCKRFLNLNVLLVVLVRFILLASHGHSGPRGCGNKIPKSDICLLHNICAVLEYRYGERTANGPTHLIIYVVATLNSHLKMSCAFHHIFHLQPLHVNHLPLVEPVADAVRVAEILRRLDTSCISNPKETPALIPDVQFIHLLTYAFEEGVLMQRQQLNRWRFL